ncbi:MAG: hypothetical protein II797_04325 [Clostridia bacterium]|nr:hypothetical protein [Clostridia bacterium]
MIEEKERLRLAEEPFELSEHLEKLSETVKNRLLPQAVREMTYTGPAPLGETPFLDVFETEREKPYLIKLAEGIVRSWAVSPVIVEKGDLLVGTPRPLRALREHFSWGIQYDPSLLKKPAYASREEELRGRIEKIRKELFPLDFSYVDSEGIRILGRDVYYGMRGLWRCGGYQGHTVPDYETLLRDGIGKTYERVHALRAKTAEEEKAVFYDALEVLLLGLRDYMLSYAERARLLASGSDGDEKRRLLAIEKNCRKVSWDPPGTFYEALQLTWFYMLWDWVDCIGRADQYLYPFYEKSAREGDVFPAEDLLAAFFLKTMEHGVHNIPLGGVDPDTGHDATNELSFQFLRLARRFHSVHPRLVARIDGETPKEFLDLIVRMWSEGMSDPTVVSDKTVIEGLTGYGVTLRDARNYTTLGCQEIEIPGKSNTGCEDGVFNLAKVLEYTLNDGCERADGLRVGLPTGHITDYSSAEELFAAYLSQIDYFLPVFVTLCNRGQEIRRANAAKLVKSLFTEDCIARGRHLDDGGAVYNHGVVETAGAAAVADSFAAIEKLVFREKVIPPDTLEKALAADFKGYEDVRLELLNRSPKFGNDDELADGYMVRLLEAFWSRLREYRSVRGGVFTGACSLLTGGISFGERTWALPDGRHAGEPLGNTIGPRPGADRSGLTALLSSVRKLPMQLGVGGTTVNVLIPKDLTDRAEKREKIATLIRTFLESGGQMAQITTASKEEMIDAQTCPERHGDLIVRVGGYSSRFVELTKETQNEIIQRFA